MDILDDLNSKLEDAIQEGELLCVVFPPLGRIERTLEAWGWIADSVGMSLEELAELDTVDIAKIHAFAWLTQSNALQDRIPEAKLIAMHRLDEILG